MAERNFVEDQRHDFGRRLPGKILDFPMGRDGDRDEVYEHSPDTWPERTKTKLLRSYLHHFRQLTESASPTWDVTPPRSSAAITEMFGPAAFLALHRLGLATEVVNSRSLLELEDDWDDLGSPAYAEATWNRAIALLIQLASRLQDDWQTPLESAEVLPGSQGNIDLELRTRKRRLLMSIPTTPDTLVRYYGHDPDEARTIKGKLLASDPNRWLLAWLAE